jgi:outer membrane protein assembly factor BamA
MKGSKLSWARVFPRKGVVFSLWNTENLPFHFSFFIFPLFLLFIPAAHADGIDIEITGQKAFNSYTLRDLLPEEPEKLKDDEVSYWGEDAGYQIEQYYQDHGYFQAVVKARADRPDPRKKEWIVTLDVKEGPLYRFGTVRVVVDGDSAAPPPGVDLRAREGRPYEREEIVRDVREITRAYGNAGFVRAETGENVVLFDSLARVDVIYAVSAGLPVVFDTLRLSIRRSGAEDSLEGLTRGSLLRSLVPYKRGDTVRVDDNDKVIEKLQSTGQFNSVRIEDTLRADGRPGSVLTLDVEEKMPGRLSTSVFYETQYGFGVAAAVSHSNIAGSLNELRLGGGLAQDKQNVSLGYGSPLIFGMLLRFDDDVTVEWFQDKLPDEPLFGGDFRVANVASLSRSIFPWLRWVGGTELEYKSRVVADSNGALSRESGGLLNFTTTGFASFLDQPLNPARGARFALTLGNGGPIYEGGEIQVVRVEERHTWAEARSAFYYYLPPIDQLKVAFRLDGGRFFGGGGQNADRFFLGGPRSVRSYGFHQVCTDIPPPAEGSCPLTETPLEPAYFLASAELRVSPFDFPAVPPRGFTGFFKPLELVPFVDYGKIWNLRGDESFSLSRDFLGSGFGRAVAYGGGLRYPLLGIFNLRLDLAWGRPGGGSWPDQWVVDLAQAF